MTREVSEARLRLMRRVLASLPESVTNHAYAEERPYLPGSRADQDAEATDSEAISGLLELAVWSLASATDHSYALERVLTPPVSQISPWTIMRNILEASASVSWLLDPADSASERVAKSLILLLENLDSIRRLARAKEGSEDSRAALVDIEERRARVLARAEELGLRLGRPKGKVILGSLSEGIGFTAITKSLLQSDADYRLLSAVAHNRYTAVTHLALEDEPHGEQGMEARRRNDDKLNSLVNSSVRWYGAAAHRYFTYRGLDTVWLEARLHSGGKLLRMRDRYWEHPSPASG